MSAERAAIRIVLERGARRAAVVALEGAPARDLRDAVALARRFDRAPRLVAVDGGLLTCRRARLVPDLFVGDLDSAPEPPPGVPSRIYPAAKDFSDFAGALEEVVALGADVAVVAGVCGGRLDHEWANLHEIGAAAPRFAAILAPSERGLTVVTSRGFRAPGAAGRIVSLFAVSRAARVTLTGARWPLRHARLVPGSLGLSNEARRGLALAVHEGVAAAVFPRLPRARRA